ncbi:DUF4136 domain-containing protein [Ketobacter sp.]|uniref:DUF4136 domain-containing protein n=1 Tax=Ketobacter sp. TaxID=2083498 RepID=UPI000F257CA2|nr:DUF4136 domain-containing protein [Ketobacter sp.]RLU00717.1 MAG: DUF4136 domain-containing protein [Ketobacter sp.]
MIPRILFSLLSLAGALSLAACATHYSVSTDYDDQYGFAGKTRYALITPEAIQTTRNDLLRNRIESALHQQLAARGFQRTDKAQADIWISYFATAEQQQDIRTYQSYNTYYGYARCYRCLYPAMPVTTDVQVIHYTEATLMIDIIDPSSNTLKWRGATSSKVTTSQADSMTVAERTEKVNQAIAAILERYPPGTAAP